MNTPVEPRTPRWAAGALALLCALGVLAGLGSTAGVSRPDPGSTSIPLVRLVHTATRGHGADFGRRPRRASQARAGQPVLAAGFGRVAAGRTGTFAVEVGLAPDDSPAAATPLATRPRGPPFES